MLEMWIQPDLAIFQSETNVHAHYVRKLRSDSLILATHTISTEPPSSSLTMFRTSNTRHFIVRRFSRFVSLDLGLPCLRTIFISARRQDFSTIVCMACVFLAFELSIIRFSTLIVNRVRWFSLEQEEINALLHIFQQIEGATSRTSVSPKTLAKRYYFVKLLEYGKYLLKMLICFIKGNKKLQIQMNQVEFYFS